MLTVEVVEVDQGRLRNIGEVRLRRQHAEMIRLAIAGLSQKQMALALGIAQPYVSKHLKAARRTLGVGRSTLLLAFDSSVADRTTLHVVPAGTHVRVPHSLSSAEAAVVRQVLAGRSNQEIANARGRALRTVINQVASVFRKLDIASRGELFVLAARHWIEHG